MADWSLKPGAMAPVVSFGYAGMMIGGAAAGLAGDRYGRRTALLGSVLRVRPRDDPDLPDRVTGHARRAAFRRRHRPGRRDSQRGRARGRVRAAAAAAPRRHARDRLRAAGRNAGGTLRCAGDSCRRLAWAVPHRRHASCRRRARPVPRPARVTALSGAASRPSSRAARRSCGARATRSPPTRRSPARPRQPAAAHGSSTVLSPAVPRTTPSRSGARSCRASSRCTSASAGCRRCSPAPTSAPGSPARV